MIIKKYATGLALLTAASLTLTACGRDTGGDTASAPATPAAAIDDSPAKGEITVWAMGGEGDQMPKIGEAFQQANPEAKVTVTGVPWDDAPTKISTAIASGQTPDVTLLNPDALAAFVAAKGFAPVPAGLIDESGFDANAIAATKIDGASYAVPLYVDTRTLFYRKDLAEKAGVSAPKTWAELNTFGAALKKAGAKEGLLLATGEAGFTHQVLLPYIWQAGGALTNADQTEFTLDTPQVIEGLAKYQSLVKDGVSSQTGTYEPWGSVEERLARGEVGSVVNGSWLIGPLKELLGDEFDQKIGIATVPAGAGGGVSWLSGGQLAVFADAKNPDGAWKFIRFISTPEQAARFSELTADLPAVTAAWGVAGLDQDPAVAVFNDQLKSTATPPVIPTWAQLSSIVDGYGERLARGTITPQDAAAGLQKDMSAVGLK
ncbi:extracellular solute-binding protein [Acrocarpospora macrocephala]|uniref:Sugar ABC transporter substrate-binding protein n=1 Tax=Acrocarpospora macrocephala TaxID=150177 RepID=A0A5M3X9N2_9ACTN|nr:extracellular solute-binding protein [Acrocarpospora macrocephala]GES14778.1 sugar ABC transporter substrate-binding protein [Acrocarpospora macrocephala]